MLKQNYKVDLAALMRIYETNYAKLLRLLPQSNEVGNSCAYAIQGLVFQLDIIEATRYTTLLNIWQHGNSPEYLKAQIKVRMYHDARVAEVCASQQVQPIKPKYDYPNTKMHQRDEKHQMNAFLADWLSHCLRNGLSKKDIFL